MPRRKTGKTPPSRKEDQAKTPPAPEGFSRPHPQNIPVSPRGIRLDEVLKRTWKPNPKIERPPRGGMN